jgi:hypothetical protein
VNLHLRIDINRVHKLLPKVTVTARASWDVEINNITHNVQGVGSIKELSRVIDHVHEKGVRVEDAWLQEHSYHKDNVSDKWARRL